jgi:hypothetical protein
MFNRRLVFINLGVLSAIGPLACCTIVRGPTAEPCAVPRPTVVAATQQSNFDGALECSISAECASCVDSHDANNVRVILTNLGTPTLSFVIFDDLPNTFSLKLPNGNDAPLTAYGRWLEEPKNYFSVPSLEVTCGLSKIWDFDIHKIFEFPDLGVYTLKVSQPVSVWTGTERKSVEVSQTIRFKVVSKGRE